MFDALSQKFETTLNRLRNRGKLTEADLDTALDEIRTALLEADVNYKVVQEFCSKVKENSLGAQVLKSLSPAQTVIKAVHDQLIAVLGNSEPLNLRQAPPVVIMVVGLQGSGKTTSCGKLAKYIRDEQRRTPLLVPADIYRPAAIEQLTTLGKQLGIEVFASSTSEKPVDIARKAIAHAKNVSLDTVIIDTAGRLQIDEQLMQELDDIVAAIEPNEILLVADAMTGQEAMNVAKGFDERLDIDGIILTKLDGDARGGAALSIRSATGKPLKFIGIGEKSDALEVFHPDRLAGRILGMGDMMTLIEKAAKEVNIEDAKSLQKKIKKNDFTLQDFYNQLQTIKKMGSMGSLMKMIPGMGQAVRGIDEGLADRELKRVEAIIQSMTPAERDDYQLIDGSRRKRIARGSGTTVEEINKLLAQFTTMRKMMKKLSNGPGGMRGLAGMMGQMGAGGRPFR